MSSEMLQHLISSPQQAFVLALMLILLIGLLAFREARRRLRQKPSIDSFGMDLLWLLKNKRRSGGHKQKRA